MINNHLHIWDSVWGDEYKKLQELLPKEENKQNKNNPIIVSNKGGKKCIQ